MNIAIKQVEESLASSKNTKDLTGLEKWQLAVKYVAMRRNPEEANFLQRYRTKKELKLAHVNRSEIERQNQVTEDIEKKKKRSNENLITQMLRFKKTREHLAATREEELVPNDYQAEQAEKFEADLSKLMDVSDGEDLTESYLGNKKHKSMTSRGNLARIMESYTNSEEEQKPQNVSNVNITIESVPTLPNMSPAMSYKSLQQPIQVIEPAQSQLNVSPFLEGSILPAICKSPQAEMNEKKYNALSQQSSEMFKLRDKKNLKKAPLRYKPSKGDCSSTSPIKFQAPDQSEWPYNKLEYIE